MHKTVNFIIKILLVLALGLVAFFYLRILAVNYSSVGQQKIYKQKESSKKDYVRSKEAKDKAQYTSSGSNDRN